MRIRSILVAALLLAAPAVAPAQTPRPSPDARVSRIVDGSRVTIIYGRPYMKGRKIWGELNPFGKVWRLGANEATLVVSQAPLEVGGAQVPAGAHSLYMLPLEDGSAKLIINRQIGQWGLEYDEKQDVARVDLKKETVSPAVEQLTIGVEKNPAGGGGLITIAWDTLKYSVPFTVRK
jgi:hypothetical protein